VNALNILVTGGAGFIGSHLSIRLLQKGYKLTIIDSLHDYYGRAIKLEQLGRVRQYGDFNYIAGDLTEEGVCKSLFEGTSFDSVIHLAAIPGVSYSFQRPDQYVDYNIKATLNVLKWAGETGVKQVIYASSSSVYGDQANQPLKEDMVNGRVISPYAATKLSGESFCHVYQSLYGFDLTILRFFTVYGPWGRPDMAIYKFIHKLLKGEEIEVFGPDSSRDYTYVDDIVKGMEAAVTRPFANESINLGSGRPIAISTLLDELKMYFPDMKVVRKPWRTGDVQTTWADIDKARELLGYVPSISFSEGLKRTVAYVREEMQR
jgi:UDP-glucuronate 4-epimerase